MSHAHPRRPGNPWTELVARAAADQRFKQRLVTDPVTILRENGIAVPPGRTVLVLENTATVIHLVLPATSESGELSEADLEKVAGGVSAEALFADPIQKPF